MVHLLRLSLAAVWLTLILSPLQADAATARTAPLSSGLRAEVGQDHVTTSVSLTAQPGLENEAIATIDWTQRLLVVEAMGLSPMAAASLKDVVPQAQAKAEVVLRRRLMDLIAKLPLGRLQLATAASSPVTPVTAANRVEVQLGRGTAKPAPVAEPGGPDANLGRQPSREVAVAGSLFEGGNRDLVAVLEEAIGHYRVQQTRFALDGSVHVRVALPFDGGPKTLGGVWATLWARSGAPGAPQLARAGLNGDRIRAVRSEARSATGLVIQAKGLGVTPCLWPRLLDRHGRLLLGPETLEPTVLMARGVASFSRGLEAAMRDLRVADHAAVVRAVSLVAPGSADLVVADEDLPDADQLVPLLAEARVVIVVD